MEQMLTEVALDLRPRVQIINKKNVSAITSLSVATIDRMVASGNFPRPIELVPGGVRRGWVLADVENWIEDRITDSF